LTLGAVVPYSITPTSYKELAPYSFSKPPYPINMIVLALK
jgi:hypothetical protein